MPVVSLNICFPNRTAWDGSFRLSANSGVLTVDGARAPEGKNIAFIGSTESGSSPIFDVNFINILKRSMSGNDFIWYEAGNGCGRCFILNSYMLGTFDLLIPRVKGRFEVSNTLMDAVPLKGEAGGHNSGGARGMSTLIQSDVTGVMIRFRNCNITLRAIGTVIGLEAAGFRITQATPIPDNGNHNISVENCAISLDVSSNPVNISAQAALINLAILDSDLYFTNCAFKLNGVVTVPDNWRSITRSGSTSGTPNRLHFKNCGLPKELESDLETGTIATLETFEGCGGNSLNCTVATIDANEFDILRADTFILDGIDAAKTIPVIKNPVDGYEITFVLKEGAAGGHAITWNAVYNFAIGAWQNSLVPDSGKTCVIKFKYLIDKWIQLTPQSNWV